MSLFDHPNFLRNVLFVDAASGLASAALMAGGAQTLSALTAIPAGLLFVAGLSLIPVAAFMAWVGSRPRIPAAGVWTIIVGNIAWVLASLFLLFGSVIQPNGYGVAFIALQAVFVGVMAELETIGVRRPSARTA